MTTDKTHNGWTNYETWAVKLWQDNEEPSYRHCRALAYDVWEKTDTDADPEDRSADAQEKLADHMKAEFEEAAPELPGVFGDLLTTAIGKVNWLEIADAWLNDENDIEGYVAIEKAAQA